MQFGKVHRGIWRGTVSLAHSAAASPQTGDRCALHGPAQDTYLQPLMSSSMSISLLVQVVAVKTMILPSNMAGAEKREKMVSD